jgi:hypothetical protein
MQMGPAVTSACIAAIDFLPCCRSCRNAVLDEIVTDTDRSVFNADIAAVDWGQVTHEIVDKNAEAKLGA